MGYDKPEALTFVRMWPYDAFERGSVTFFADWDCKGAHGRLYVADTEGQDEDFNASRHYNSSEIDEAGIKPRTTTSLIVPFGYSAKFHNRPGVPEFTVTGNYYTTKNLNMYCLNLTGYHSNSMDSVTVFRNDWFWDPACPDGNYDNCNTF